MNVKQIVFFSKIQSHKNILSGCSPGIDLKSSLTQCVCLDVRITMILEILSHPATIGPANFMAKTDFFCLL